MDFSAVYFIVFLSGNEEMGKLTREQTLEYPRFVNAKEVGECHPAQLLNTHYGTGNADPRTAKYDDGRGTGQNFYSCSGKPYLYNGFVVKDLPAGYFVYKGSKDFTGSKPMPEVPTEPFTFVSNLATARYDGYAGKRCGVHAEVQGAGGAIGKFCENKSNNVYVFKTTRALRMMVPNIKYNIRQLLTLPGSPFATASPSPPRRGAPRTPRRDLEATYGKLSRAGNVTLGRNSSYDADKRVMAAMAPYLLSLGIDGTMSPRINPRGRQQPLLEEMVVFGPAQRLRRQ